MSQLQRSIRKPWGVCRRPVFPGNRFYDFLGASQRIVDPSWRFQHSSMTEPCLYQPCEGGPQGPPLRPDGANPRDPIKITPIRPTSDLLGMRRHRMLARERQWMEIEAFDGLTSACDVHESLLAPDSLLSQRYQISRDEMEEYRAVNTPLQRLTAANRKEWALSVTAIWGAVLSQIQTQTCNVSQHWKRYWSLLLNKVLHLKILLPT